jgi:hypothetical protein
MTKVKWIREVETSFNEWMKDGNVNKNSDGTYSTQDAQWRNRITNLSELKKYFITEFLM